ncbi:MAG: hypothetical protein DMF71_06240, partial [Acidobacteria bacterium]
MFLLDAFLTCGYTPEDENDCQYQYNRRKAKQKPVFSLPKELHRFNRRATGGAAISIHHCGKDICMRTKVILFSILIALLFSTESFAQSSVLTIRGAVTIGPFGTAARNALVTIVELKRSVLTSNDGTFELINVPRGTYQIMAHLDRVPDVVKIVEVANDSQRIDFQLSLAPVSEQV